LRNIMKIHILPRLSVKERTNMFFALGKTSIHRQNILESIKISQKGYMIWDMSDWDRIVNYKYFKWERYITKVWIWNKSLFPLTPKMINDLAKNDTIRELGIYSENIGDDGAKAIADVFLQNNTLSTLRVWDNIIGDNGAKAIARALLQNIN